MQIIYILREQKYVGVSYNRLKRLFAVVLIDRTTYTDKYLKIGTKRILSIISYSGTYVDIKLEHLCIVYSSFFTSSCLKAAMF
jgi:hypothetical protein